MGDDGFDRRVPWNDLNLTKEIGFDIESFELE